MMSIFFNNLEGATLRENSERTVYELLSGHYNVRNVRKISDRVYHVDLRDGKTLTVKTYPRTTMFGDEKTTITGIY